MGLGGTATPFEYATWAELLGVCTHRSQQLILPLATWLCLEPASSDWGEEGRRVKSEGQRV